jgi:hypothetical protein
MALIRPSTFFRQINPRGAVRDFVEVWRQAGKNRWRIAVLSATVTTAIFSMMWQEEMIGPPRRPTIDYITVWDPHRTDAEIMASNIANQKRKDRLAAEQTQREEDVRQIYKTLGRASGMDVDAIEAKAKADREADARASAAAATRKAPVVSGSADKAGAKALVVGE